MSVLLVEDSDDDAYLFERALKKAALACSLGRALNGKMAVEKLAAAAHSNSEPGTLPDLIFLDLKMPVLSGFDVLEWIRSNELTSLKVVVLSGSDEHADRVRAADLGAFNYFVKPIASEDLKLVVSGVIADKEALHVPKATD